jgi:hypothetical protein
MKTLNKSGLEACEVEANERKSSTDIVGPSSQTEPSPGLSQPAPLAEFIESANQMEPSPHGKIWSFIVDVRNSYSYKQVDGTSRGNSFTMHYTIAWVEKMMDELSLPASAFMIVSAYTLQVNKYKAFIRDNPKFRGLKVRTVNRVQGHENPIVVWDGVCGENMNGRVGFLDSHRMAVIPTRQTQFFFAVVDSACVEQKRKNTEEEPSNVTDTMQADESGDEDGEVMEDNDTYKIEALKRFLKWFEERGRVIQGDATITYSPYCHIINKDNYDQEKEAVNAQNTSAINHLKELDVEPVEGFKYQEPEEEDNIDAGPVEQLSLDINATGPELLETGDEPSIKETKPVGEWVVQTHLDELAGDSFQVDLINMTQSPEIQKELSRVHPDSSEFEFLQEIFEMLSTKYPNFNKNFDFFFAGFVSLLTNNTANATTVAVLQEYLAELVRRYEAPVAEAPPRTIAASSKSAFPAPSKYKEPETRREKTERDNAKSNSVIVTGQAW